MEELAKNITVLVSHVVEITSATVIGVAVIKVIMGYFFTRNNFSNPLQWQGHEKAESIRVQFGSAVAVALELLLGADVLATAVAPGWDAIGKLAAIAVLRTALNYFLERELNQRRDHNHLHFKPGKMQKNETVF